MTTPDPPPPPPPPPPPQDPTIVSADVFDKPLNLNEILSRPEGQPAPTPEDPVPYYSPPTGQPFERHPDSENHSYLWRQVLIPFILLATGWGAVVTASVLAHGGNLLAAQLGAAIVMGIRSIMTALICMVAVPIMGGNIGHFPTYLLRIASLVVFTTSLALVVPYLGQMLLAPIAAWFLMAWYFDLDPIEALILSVLVNILQFLIAMAFGLAALSYVFS